MKCFFLSLNGLESGNEKTKNFDIDLTWCDISCFRFCIYVCVLRSLSQGVANVSLVATASTITAPAP